MKHIVKGQIEEGKGGEEDVSSYCKFLRKESVQDFETESTRSRSLKNSF
jgi:hypothetical protein